MTINYTSLLGLAQPVTGTEANTWGTVVNDEITALIEEAVAGGESLNVTSGNITLTDTDGVPNQARNAILIITGTPGVSRDIIAPSQSKTYIVINGSDGAVVIKGSATSGTTIASGIKAVVAWDGADFVTIASTAIDGVSTISFGTTGLTPNTPTSGAVSVGGTLAIGSGGTGQTSQQSAINALAGAVTSGQYLRGNGTNVVMNSIQVGDVPTLNQNTTGSAASLSISGQTGLLTFTGLTSTNRAKTVRDAADTVLELGGSYTPTGTWNWTSATVTWPTFAVGNGGTGQTSLTLNNVILGNGTSAVQFVAPGTNGNVLTSNGTTWTSSTPAAQVYPAAGIAVSTGSAWTTSLTAPTGAVVGTSDTQTLTNKRVNPRAVAAGATSGNLTPNGDTTDVFNAFSLSGSITLLAPSGTPVDGQRLVIRLEDNGGAQGITWTTSSGAYRAVGVTLPTTTTAGKVTYVGCMYNSTDIFWDVIAVVTQA